MSNRAKFIVLFLILVYLGFWQINRGLEKKKLAMPLRAHKHFGYALQWFSFAGLSLIYYVKVFSKGKDNDS